MKINIQAPILIVFLLTSNCFGAMVVPTARTNGMGNAFTAVADGASAIGYNPAGLAFIVKNEVSASTGPFPTDPNINYSNFSFATKTQYGVFGGSLSNLVTITNTPSFENFLDNRSTATWSYSNKITNNISYGVNFNSEAFNHPGHHLTERERLMSTISTYDIGFLGKFNNYSIGLMIGSALYFNEYFEDDTPLHLRLGMAFKPIRRLTIATDFARFLGGHHDEQYQIHTGLEYNIINPLTIRCGYISDQIDLDIKDRIQQTSMIGATIYLTNEFLLDFSRQNVEHLSITDSWGVRYLF